jgi:hypothetical protein
MSRHKRLPAVLFAFGLLTLSMGASRGDSGVARALARIRSGPHSQMPAPAAIATTGPAGKGMVIVNGTPYPLHVYFRGPVTRHVVIPRRQHRGVALVVGEYEVGAEVPGSGIRPFYGRQSYRAHTYYEFRFYLR